MSGTPKHTTEEMENSGKGSDLKTNEHSPQGVANSKQMDQNLDKKPKQNGGT